MAIASMILGISSIVFSQSFGLITAILVLIFSKKAETNEGPSGFTKTGRICGIIGLVLSILTVLFVIGYIAIVFGGTLLMLIMEGM